LATETGLVLADLVIRPHAVTPALAPQSVPTLLLRAPADALNDAELLCRWRQRLAAIHPLNRPFATPEWFAYRARTHPAVSRGVAVVRDGASETIGICPFEIRTLELPYVVSRSRLAIAKLRALVVSGSEPLLAASAIAYRQLFEGVLAECPDVDCIQLASVPADGVAWRLIHGECRSGSTYFAYLVGSPGRCRRFINLGNDFGQLLGSMGAKSRYNLKRTLRVFDAQSGGDVQCLKVTTEDQVDDYCARAHVVSERSWQHRMLGPREDQRALSAADLRGLARSGMLRSYLLSRGGEACSYVVGYQHAGVFHYAEIGYDSAIARLSPGTVLLHHVLDDLYANDPPALFDFGVGDAPHKRRFATGSVRDASVLVLRRSVRNYFVWASHGSLQSSVRLVKRVLRLERAAPADADE
jgi:hypothetical protein